MPLLLTQKMKSTVDLLVSSRGTVGINQDNIFLFARCHYGSLGHLRGSDMLRLKAKECGAAMPHLLRSTGLRKQIATVSQVLNLKNNELDLLAKFMGHDIRVHRQYYRLPEETLQAAKVAKMLLLMEKGENVIGKNLDDIDVTITEGELVTKRPP